MRSNRKGWFETYLMPLLLPHFPDLFMMSQVQTLGTKWLH